MAENGTHMKQEALVDSPTFVLEEEGLLRSFRFRKMAENGTHVKEEALVDSPTSVLEEEDSGEPTSSRNPEKQPKQAEGARKKRKRADNCGACTGISRPCGPDCSYRMLFPTSNTNVEACLINKFFKKDKLLELAEKCKNAEEINKCRRNLFRICGWLRSDPVNVPLVDHAALKVKAHEYMVLMQKGLLRAFRFRKMAENGTHVKEEALVDSPTSVLEEEDSGEPTSSRNPEKQPKQAKGARKKRKRADKCGACTGISRPCGPDCSYRMLFPTSSTKVEACLINKFFKKDQLLELAEKCKNAEKINKCRGNLFRICGWLQSDPVNIADEYMVLMQKIGA